jgi:aerobic-type carbon monoxide dehydrogenase small subunit (CoxS/CutS family)
MTTIFSVNGRPHSTDEEAETPLLWVLRDEIGLKGTKFGCGIGMCGACTVHVGGRPTRSCITPVSAVEGAEITTIEGLDPKFVGSALGALLLTEVLSAVAFLGLSQTYQYVFQGGLILAAAVVYATARGGSRS